MFTETVRVPPLEPEAGVTDNQLPPGVVLSEEVQFSVPPPTLDTSTVWLAGLATPLALKFKLDWFSQIRGELLTVNDTALLTAAATVTTTLPVVAPEGTGTAMLVALQLVGAAAIPLKVTVLLPCVAPNPVPAIVTTVPMVPGVGERLVIVGPME